MATKRRPLHQTTQASKLNFRPGVESQPWEAKGKKPLPEPTSVKHVLLMMVIHVCRKAIFVDTSIKVGIYGASLFIVSLLADVLPFPKTYFSRSDNALNQYFVKLGWLWTLMLTVPFVVMTSYTYCCGNKNKVLQHLGRLGVATFSWFFWTKLFAYIEVNFGRCNAKNFHTKATCLGAGYYWHGFDLSGHAFILIYSSLVLIEEARAIIGWESIQDFLRNEEHSRNVGETSVSSNPLRGLSFDEFEILKQSYNTFTPYIRGLFIAMTCFSVLWDVMLITTILYYHVMIEKFISGAIAILTWFFTYRFWYTLPQCLPNLPGEGTFRYKDRQMKEPPVKRRAPPPTPAAKGNLPTFMGMPLYGLRNIENKEDKEDTQTADMDTPPPPAQFQPRRSKFDI